MLREHALEKIIEKFEKYNLDAIVVSNLDNVRYLSGFTGSEGAILISRNGNYFLTGTRYTTQASEQADGFIIREYDNKEKEIERLALKLNIKSLGFEPQYVTFEVYNKLLEKLQDTKLIPIAEGLDSVRDKKEDLELKLIKDAVRIASESYLDVAGRIKVGIEEREVALEIEYLMRKKGAEKVSFDTIVASGRRSALPHGIATSKRIEKGEFIVIDFGARYHGYYSDETQTLVVGRPTTKQKKIYRIVKEAHEKAFEAIKPGVSVIKVDSAARDHIDRAGFGKYFGHGTGHGVGLAVHEMPYISPLGKGLIEEGMVFTIEPGIYIPKWGGVRIEDMVRVTSRGYERLTFLPKELQVID
jgi:Xaa-Pro aminopeptidase